MFDQFNVKAGNSSSSAVDPFSSTAFSNNNKFDPFGLQSSSSSMFSNKPFSVSFNFLFSFGSVRFLVLES